MQLGALLTLLRNAILNDRTDRSAGTSDYLWEDATLVTFINEAQRRFAVKGLILQDATTDAVTLVTLATGQANYPLDKSVLAVISAKMSTQDADLSRVGHSFLSAYRAPTDQWIDPACFSGLPPGATLAFSTDEGLVDATAGSFSQVSMRVHPVPAAAQNGQTIRLRVLRKPLADLSIGALTAVPEIPEDHHIEMLDYAAYLALRIVDDDAGAPKRAEEFREMFEANVKAARIAVMKKLFTPLGWGFGRAGFSWDN